MALSFLLMMEIYKDSNTLLEQSSAWTKRRSSALTFGEQALKKLWMECARVAVQPLKNTTNKILDKFRSGAKSLSIII